MFLESGDLFGFAGLYCSFIDVDGIKKIGFVIASMPTNEHISKVRHRQPELILKNNMEEWLDNSCKEPERLIYHAEGQEIQFLNEIPAPKETIIPKKKSKKTNQPELF
ncbi:SOS response-associated peptidase family protein [Leptospira santarosai]|uniref:SOS response-associated peptidase family protein n=1 Tax=Leptospira santarosai TaxID=28183 RepID=UPI0005182ECD|nr:SOS response-associated peptidase family protein [Leptospira santarosai]